jgi:PKD repeat protein
MKKWFGLLAVLGGFVLVNSLAGQGLVSGEDVTQKGTFKWVPNELGDTPEWAERMYSGDADFHEIADLRAAYLKDRPYEKTLHERNFKHWLMHVEHRVGPDGVVQDAGEWAAEAFERGGGVEGQVQRAAEVDPEWQAIGPFETWNNGEQGHFPVSWQCNIYCFDQSTSNPDVAIAGIEAGDLFKTTNKGQSWTPVTLGVPGIRTVTQCAVAPSSASNFYFVSNNTVYGSINGGSTWDLLYNLGSAANQLVVHPWNSDRVYVATDNGLRRTLDGGANWSTVISGKVWDVRFHPTDAMVVYALVHELNPERCAFYRSDDGGATFQLHDTGYFVPSDAANADDHGGRIGTTPADPDRVYVALIGKGKSSDTGWIGLYRSDNNGDNWTNPNGQDGAPYDVDDHPSLATGNMNGTGIYQGFYDFAMAVSHVDPDRVWVGVTALNATDDGGVTWQRIGAYGANTYDIGWVHPDIQDMHVLGDDVWVASDGGLNYSSDELATHESRKYGIYNTTLWGFSQGWNEDVQTGGRYHNGNTGFRQDFGAAQHLRLGGAEAPTGYVNPLDAHELRFSDIGDLRLPQAFNGTPSGIGNLSMYPTESYVDSRSSELVVDPLYADHLALGNGSGFYRSYDGGADFNMVHNFGSGTVLEIEQGRGNRELFFAVVRAGSTCSIYRSLDGGQNWSQLTGLPTNWSSMEIALNPADDDELWAIKADDDEVRRSLNGGDTWANLGAGLFGEALRDVVCLGDAGTVVVSTTGAFHRAADASGWTSFGTGLPARWAPFECLPFYRDEVLRVGDKGKGIWQADFPFAPSPIAQPMTSNPVVFCAGDSVHFDSYSIVVNEGATWTWTFDPQPEFVSSSAVRNPVVIFGQGGDYDVSLTVTDAEGMTDTKSVAGMVQVGPASQCEASGIPGMALECSGSNGYGLTHDLGIETNTYTVMAWVRPDGIQPDYAAIAIAEGNGGGFNFRQNNELGYHWPNGAWWWSSGLTVAQNEWSHVAMTVAPDGVRLYLNGQEAHDAFSPVLGVQGAQFLGNYRGWGSRNMTGGIDEVKIWNRTLSRDEIREQRHLTLSPAQVEADSDLVGYYQFNEDTYFMVNKQGSSQHGVFTGPAALASSEAVVGSGVLDRVMVDGSGSFALDAVGGAIEVAPGAAVPNGEVVVHRLDPAPPSGPEQGLPMGYWVVDTYGSGSFDAGTSWMMGASEGSLAPWMQGMADLAVVQRDPLGLEPWSVPCDMAPASDQTALYDGACGPLASAQYALVSEVCVLDTTAAGLCPEEVLVWGNSLVEGPGLYYALGAQGDDCLTLEVLDIEFLDTSPLYWNLEGEQIQAPDGWTDHVWTLNGTVLDAGGAVIPLAGSGDYTLTATDPVSGCTVAYTGTVGCPGDLDGDFIVGVSDILQLLGSFGCTDDCDNSDVNADGSVNVTDVLFLLGLFGSMC